MFVSKCFFPFPPNFEMIFFVQKPTYRSFEFQKVWQRITATDNRKELKNKIVVLKSYFEIIIKKAYLSMQSVWIPLFLLFWFLFASSSTPVDFVWRDSRYIRTGKK